LSVWRNSLGEHALGRIMVDSVMPCSSLPIMVFVDSLNRVIRVEEITENVPHHDHASATNIAARRFHAQRNM